MIGGFSSTKQMDISWKLCNQKNSQKMCPSLINGHEWMVRGNLGMSYTFQTPMNATLETVWEEEFSCVLSRFILWWRERVLSITIGALASSQLGASKSYTDNSKASWKTNALIICWNFYSLILFWLLKLSTLKDEWRRS